ncbi:MAG: hypothetical protein OXG25_01375 [Gammaproteobacteria bacterium]|nr:hypothetical protein [Gammaproteobacteria bacterium]
MCINFRQALLLIFYRPRDVLASNWEQRKWIYVFVLLFLLSYADTLIGFRATTSTNVIVEVIPTVMFFVIVLFSLTILILIDVLYLRAVSAVFGLEQKLDHWLGFVTWSGVPGAAFVLVMTTVLSLTLFLSSDVLGRESSALANIIFGSRFSNLSQSSFFQYRFIADLWLVTVQGIGLRELSGKSFLICFAIVIVPIILVHIVIRWNFF